MSSTPPPSGTLFVESLEARIAPTNLIALANNPAFSTDPNYVTYTTAPADGKLGFVPASSLGVGGANLYAIKLTGDGSVDDAGRSTGDKLLIFNAVQGFNPNNPFLQAVKGSMYAFFQDTNGDNQVQTSELVGLSLSKKTSVNVNGNVNGDIVTNLSKDGNTILLDSVGNKSFAISNLTVVGNVGGSILSGGGISNTTITGTVNNVLSGSAAGGATYNFTGLPGNVTGTLNVAAFKPGQVGATINNLSLISLVPGGRVQAGDGGVGATGGAVSNLLIQGDADGFSVLAGNGGPGTDSVKGGVGGAIDTVQLIGVANTVDNHQILIQAGHGGNNDAFKGGAGGNVTGVATSFDTFDFSLNTGAVSGDQLTQNITIHGGDGGNGLKGAKGGSVSSSNIVAASPDDGSANPELQVIAGHGGLATTDGRGHGNKGGSVNQVVVQNLNTTATSAASALLVQGGDGGQGRDGGNLNGISVLGRNIVLSGGLGADGINHGGDGGSLNTINVDNLTNLFARQVIMNAGSGGAASNGPGGAGGDIAAVTVIDSDLALLVVNDGTHANGGTGGNGVGGAGGSVSNLNVSSSDASVNNGTVTVRAGVGGDGLRGGGGGGGIDNSSLVGTGFGFNFAAGAGGSVLAGGSGKGAGGGDITVVGIANQFAKDPVELGSQLTTVLGTNYAAFTGTVTAGAGGNGTTKGGAGGGLAQVNLSVASNITMVAGNGGAGSSRAAGAGGDVSNSAGVSLGGAVSVTAGNAGGDGSRAGNGGTVSIFTTAAQTDVTIRAGNGTNGGAGGSVTDVVNNLNPLYIQVIRDIFGDVTDTFNTSNFGNIAITAGNGSSRFGVAGAGGSISNFRGYVGHGGSGQDITDATRHVTSLQAGNGGGGDGETASGAGGSVTDVSLQGNILRPVGDPTVDLAGTQLITIDAGNAGNATLAKKGAAGGAVTTATVYNLDFATVLHHVSAGDGANAVKRGGAGGTVTTLNVGTPGDAVADIGVRSGASYGFDYTLNQAGGISSGVGGTGSKSAGANGDVTDVTASAISSIVSGKGATPQLATNVDRIILEGLVATLAGGDGSFTNFGTANLVGSVVNPGASGASVFKPGDGLIAAINFTDNRNFVPEALLTVDGGNRVFIDFQQPNPTPVIIQPIPPYL